MENEKRPDTKKINELSESLKEKFTFRKDCKHCWGRGIQAMQFKHKSDFIYTPCVCVRAK
jgi:predicted methyltransferase